MSQKNMVEFVKGFDMSEKLGHLNLSAFQPIPPEMLIAPESRGQRSSFMDNVRMGGSGNANRQNLNAGYQFDNGASLGTAFGTSGGKQNQLHSVDARIPLGRRASLSMGYQPVAGNMGQEQFGGKLKYNF